MKKRILYLTALFALIAAVGCGGTVVPVEEETRLGETTDVDVAAWLKLSRPELAKLTDEWAVTVKHDQEAARNSPDAIELLPKLRPQVHLPAFQVATYSELAGISLPPYVSPGSRDTTVALHLARFGDHEGAFKLADPADAASQQKIVSIRGQKNYPVEWSRLVGLVLASSQLKLAGGDVDSATRLVLVHKQLREILDSRTAEGPLGSVLLPTGRRALILAAKAWREPGVAKNALADDIDKAVAEWGSLPGPVPALLPGESKDKVAKFFGMPVSGKVVNVLKPEAMFRPLDLMSLPIPSEALAVISAFLDKTDHLAEIQLTYRAKIEDIYPEAANLACQLDECGMPLKGESVEASLYHQTYVGSGLSFEAVRTNRSNTLGGWVLVRAAKDPAKPAMAHSLRVFGPADLDHRFETNRQALSPGKSGTEIVVTAKPALESLTAELHLPCPAGANLEREKEHDLLAALRVTWAPEQTSKALEGLLPMMWSAFGNARVAAVEDSTGAFLGFTWQDEHSQIQLRFPFDDNGPVLVMHDTRGKKHLAERVVAVRKRDEDERKARLTSGKPEERLPRSLGMVNDLTLDALRLGQIKSEAETLLPSGKSYRRKDFPGGVSVVILNTPLRGSVFWARQIILRYENNRVAEIRLRYQEGLTKARKGETLLGQLEEGKSGAPEGIPASWEGLWSGLPRSGKAVQWRWEDDLTIRTYQSDAGGSEVVLTDRASADEGQPLGKFAFIPSGVTGCHLGESREAVQTALQAPAASSGGADVHRQPANSPYEMLLVWYVDSKVSRIVAVHRVRPGNKDNDAAAALSQAWGRDVAGLGFIRRQEGERGRIRASYFWNDDFTRVETFVQEDEQGTRLMTEWRSWSTNRPATTVQLTRKPSDLSN